MPKAYWIAHVGADDDAKFQLDGYKAYVSGAAPVFKEYNAKFLARGGAFELMEGYDLGSRHVVIEFESLEQARACYNSDTYKKAREHRIAISNATIILVEGIEN